MYEEIVGLVLNDISLPGLNFDLCPEGFQIFCLLHIDHGMRIDSCYVKLNEAIGSCGQSLGVCQDIPVSLSLPVVFVLCRRVFSIRDDRLSDIFSVPVMDEVCRYPYLDVPRLMLVSA